MQRQERYVSGNVDILRKDKNTLSIKSTGNIAIFFNPYLLRIQWDNIMYLNERNMKKHQQKLVREWQ